MKTIFLHIGAHKTGTSTIQASLEQSDDQLSELNLFYPTSFNNLFDYPHRHFISTGNVNPLGYSMRYPTDPATYKGFEIESVLKKLETVIENGKNIILSHEDLLFASVDFLQKIREWSSSLGYRVNPILFVRDQLSWHCSAFNQQIRQLMSTESFETLVAKNMGSAEWHKYATKYANIFGHKNMTVRLYDRKLINGSLTKFFINSLGCKAKSFCDPDIEDKNVSISHAAALMVMHFNRHTKNRKMRNRLLKTISECNTNSNETPLDQHTASIICSHYSEGNRVLMDKFLTEEEASQLRKSMQNNYEQYSAIETKSLSLAGEVLVKLI